MALTVLYVPYSLDSGSDASTLTVELLLAQKSYEAEKPRLRHKLVRSVLRPHAGKSLSVAARRSCKGFF